MKYLKYFLILLLGLIIIYLLTCLLGPKDLDTIRSTEISSSASIPFNLANSLRNTEQWNAWSLQDSSMQTTYNDIVEGVGARSSWTSDASGNGSQEITESELNRKVRSKLNFEGFSGDNFAELTFDESSNKTNVTWAFDAAPLPFLFRGFALFTGMKGLMKRNYDEGLANLKRLSEERARGAYDGFEIREEDLSEKHFIMTRQEVDSDKIQQFYTTNLGALFNKAQSAGIEMAGMPCGLFFRWDETGAATTDMAAAIPIAEAITIKDASSYSIPAKRALTLDFYGDYHGISQGHDAIEAYMKDRGYLPDPPIIEEYVTDPGQEPDPSKWLTKMTQYFTEQ